MKRIGRNALWNVVEIATSSFAIFVLFKIIVSKLGVEALGVWSLVLATTSLARLADLGVAGGLGRIVAQANARQGLAEQADADPLEYIETALFANALLYLTLAIIAYWPASRALAAVLEGDEQIWALELLPFALASFVLASSSGVLAAALLGFNRSDLKSQIMIASIVIQIGVTAAMATSLGLRGVALGQMAQSALVIGASWIGACRQTEGRFVIRIPTRFSVTLLRPLASFGARVQAVTLAAFLYEPIVKFLIAANGGASMLGLFEMAFRLVTQSRQFLAAPCQNLLPLFVQATEAGRSVEPIYTPAVAVVGVLGAVGMSLLTLATPLISLVWLGRIDPSLVLFVGVLSMGWFVNIATIPAFYLGMASGRLRWNVAGSAATTLSALLIGWPLGHILGPVGIVIGSSLAVAVGGIVIGWGNSRASNINPFPNAGTFRFLTTLAATRLGLVR